MIFMEDCDVRCYELWKNYGLNVNLHFRPLIFFFFISIAGDISHHLSRKLRQCSGRNWRILFKILIQSFEVSGSAHEYFCQLKCRFQCASLPKTSSNWRTAYCYVTKLELEMFRGICEHRLQAEREREI